MKTVHARARIAAVGIATSGAMLLAGCGASNEAGSSGSSGSSGTSAAAAVSGTISGAGASTQQAATQAWVAGFQTTNPDATINYDPSGSGAGRTQFIAGGVDYAGSDSPMKADEITQAKAKCASDIVEVPVYVSPIAIAYNLPGVTDLQLTPALIAQIFNKKITKWNDPAIAGVNAGKTLPDTNIQPVVRADKSGTVANFTDYLSKAAKADWPYPSSDTWPVAGQDAKQGTSGVVKELKAGVGTIGYADDSQAKAASIGIAKIQVGSDYVAPSADGAAKLVDAAQKATGGGPYIFSYTLPRTTTDTSQYPITLVSYAIACSKYADSAKGALVKAYFTYITSADGQAAAAKAAGSAPLSDTVRTAITPAVTAIS